MLRKCCGEYSRFLRLPVVRSWTTGSREGPTPDREPTKVTQSHISTSINHWRAWNPGRSMPQTQARMYVRLDCIRMTGSTAIHSQYLPHFCAYNIPHIPASFILSAHCLAQPVRWSSAVSCFLIPAILLTLGAELELHIQYHCETNYSPSPNGIILLLKYNFMY